MHLNPAGHTQCRRGWGEAVKITRARRPERWPGVHYVAYVFVFLGSIIVCCLYKLTLSDQDQVSLQLTVSLSEAVYRFLAGPPLLRAPRKNFHRGPNPLLAALAVRQNFFLLRPFPEDKMLLPVSNMADNLLVAVVKPSNARICLRYRYICTYGTEFAEPSWMSHNLPRTTLWQDWLCMLWAQKNRPAGLQLDALLYVYSHSSVNNISRCLPIYTA
jgi:hypothetical protein